MRRIREGDIFNFYWSVEEKNKRFMPHHCFDGQLEAQECRDGLIRLFDTYWHDRHNGKTPQEWRKLGKLEFIINLNDTEEIPASEVPYYRRKDVFNLGRT